MTTAAPGHGVSPELLDGIVARASREDFPAFEAQLRSSGYCARPVRLKGTIESCDAHGNRRMWSTENEPDGVLRKACGNRREAVCPPCAERYRGDAFQLLAAGMRGGKGVPDTVVEHPALFATLTAPSFGPVHCRRVAPDGQPLPCHGGGHYMIWRLKSTSSTKRIPIIVITGQKRDADRSAPLDHDTWDMAGR